MTVFVSQTVDAINSHINRYWALQDESVNLPEKSLSDIKLPQSFKISAPQINEASFSRRLGRKRERRLKGEKGKAAREALKKLNEAGALSGHDANVKIREDLRKFETSNARLRELRTLRLRTKRAWAKFAAAERRYIQDYARFVVFLSLFNLAQI